MRHIGNLSDSEQARLFHDYLYARGIGNQVEQDGPSGWMIWVADEEQVEQARTLLEKFRQDPAAPEYSREASAAGQMRTREAREESEYRKRFFTSRQVFPGNRSLGAGVVTYGLIVACVLVSLFSHGGDDKSFLRPFYINDPFGDSAGFFVGGSCRAGLAVVYPCVNAFRAGASPVQHDVAVRAGQHD